jgi:hypothetical protein
MTTYTEDCCAADCGEDGDVADCCGHVRNLSGTTKSIGRRTLLNLYASQISTWLSLYFAHSPGGPTQITKSSYSGLMKPDRSLTAPVRHEYRDKGPSDLL